MSGSMKYVSMASHPSVAAPILAMLGIALLVLSGYAGGYLWLGETRTIVMVDELGVGHVECRITEITRVFPQPWHATFFLPATWVESAIWQIRVNATDDLSWTIEHAFH